MLPFLYHALPAALSQEAHLWTILDDAKFDPLTKVASARFIVKIPPPLSNY